MGKDIVSQAMQAEAWHRFWPVLVELGANERFPGDCGLTGCEVAIAFVRALAAERAAAVAELRAARKHLAEALRVIRGVEWIYKNGRYYCPLCEIPRELGHAPGCTLAAALAMGEGGGSTP